MLRGDAAMADFFQNGLVTTLHDLGNMSLEPLERLVERCSKLCPTGLVLPVTAADMRAEPFRRIVTELTEVRYISRTVVVLGLAPNVEDYREAVELIRPLEERACVLWTDGERVQNLYRSLQEAGLDLGSPGKGRSVWTAFGYLLSEPRLQAFVLHDCDIVNYSREMLARLCLPLVHPSLDFEFCKAYYARFTDRMHGRVARLLVTPLIRALIATVGHDRFLWYLDSFRYPLAGEMAVTANLAKHNRIPSDWGLELGTLAEVYRNTSIKRVCQVDMCRQYEHKHQQLSLDNPEAGLMKMATDLILTIFRTLSSMGVVFQSGLFTSLRSAYLRMAQDAIRQYHADAVMNGLRFDRHSEESAVEGFARQILVAAERFQEDPAGGQPIPNWNRVISALPDFPHQLRQAVEADLKEFCS